MDREKSPSNIPEEVRERAANLIREGRGEDGSIFLPKISQLLTAADINWRDFSREGEKLGPWLDRNFPEFKRSGDGRSLLLVQPQPLYPAVSQELLAMMDSVIEESLDQDRSVLQSALGSALRSRGIDRHAYTNKGLAEWLTGLFPDLKRSEDSQRLYREGKPDQVPPPKTMPEYPQGVRPLSGDDREECIRLMHCVAFMGWWGNNTRLLKRYTGCTGSDGKVWSGLIAGKMNELFDGGGQLLLGRTETGACRVGFYTGMDTPGGEPIFCILTENPLYRDGNQAMILEGFCYRGAPENPALSAWLEEKLCASAAPERVDRQTEATRLREACARLEALRETLTGRTQGILALLQAGKPLEETLPELGDYCEKWKQVSVLADAAGVSGDRTTIEQLRGWCDQQLSGPEKLREERVFTTAGRLLEDACAGNVWGFWNSLGGADRLEELILANRIREAGQMAADRNAMAAYTETARLEICRKLEEVLPQGRDFSARARRLRKVLGEDSSTALRYSLLGLFVEPSKAAPELLRRYREQDQWEKFQKLWSGFEKDVPFDGENHIYYLRHAEEPRAYLDSRVYLYYLPQCANAVAEAASEQERRQMQQRAEMRARLAARPMNRLEQALVADDTVAVLEMINHRDSLREMGYSEEQITRISQAALTENYPSGLTPYETGRRIYLYQGSLHGLAEGCLWQGLAEAPAAQRSELIIQLLAGEQRWSECIRLYRCYGEGAEMSLESRQAYMLAMLRDEPAEAQRLIQKDLQGFLALIRQEPEAQHALENCRNSSDESFRSFYQGLWQLNQMLEEDVVRSVILHDSSLRDCMAQPERLARMGLDDQQAENARSVYRSGQYAQGADAVSLAKRAYAFFGTYWGVAEKLSRFALPAEDAVELLWTILERQPNTGELDRLLEEYPRVRQAHPVEYSRYLLDKGQYASLLSWLRQRENTPMEALLQAVAQVKLDPQAQIRMPELEEPLDGRMQQILIRLSAALVQAGRFCELCSILFENFDLLLQSCSSEILKKLMGADGALTAQTAEAFQREALEQGLTAVAVYYYNHWKVGDLSPLAEAYYRTLVPNGETSEGLALAAKLYPEKARELHDRAYLKQVKDLLARRSADREIPETLSEVLNGCTLTGQGLRSLIGAVQSSPYGAVPTVIRSVTALADRAGIPEEGLRYVHQAAQKAPSDSFLTGELLRAYQSALDRGTFPEDLRGEAEQMCQALVRRDRRQYQAVFCLYRLDRLMGGTVCGEYALQYLTRQSDDDLGSALSARTAREAAALWGGNAPSGLDLLRRVLREQTMEQLLQYCDFCGILAEPAEGDQAVMYDHIQNMSRQKRSVGSEEYRGCSEEAGEILVNVLLGAQDNADHWWACSGLPDLTVEARAKLLYRAGQLKSAYWTECLSYCETAGVNGWLLRALGALAREPVQGAKKCRGYLEQALSREPGYFDRWTTPEDAQVLLEILKAMCTGLLEESGTISKTVAHTALNAISLIAVSLRADEAVGILERQLSELLLGAYSEIGVATACRLLKEGRTDRAEYWLKGLTGSGGTHAWGRLVEMLNGKTREELEKWVSDSENKMLLDMTLPDGNLPRVPKIQSFILDRIQMGQAQAGARVISALIDVLPNDYASCNALFILCKCGGGDPVLLHKSLSGLIRNTTRGETYYRRSYLWNAKLLAGVNAVIRARGLEGAVSRNERDYVSNQQAGSYCQVKGRPISLHQVQALNNMQTRLEDSLKYLPPEELDRRCRVILTWVTGDWTELLWEIWQGRADEQDVSALKSALELDYDREDQDLLGFGFCRSLLRILKRLAWEDRNAFLRWVRWGLTGLTEEIPGKLVDLKGKRRQLAMASDLVENGILDRLGDFSLELPLEEYSLNTILVPKLIKSCIGVDPRLLFNRLWTYCAIADYSEFLQNFCVNFAQERFNEGDFSTAAAGYEAAQKLLARGQYFLPDPRDDGVIKRAALEYKAYARISRLMIRDKTLDLGFLNNSWSCLNMTLALMASYQGELAPQLLPMFAGENHLLCEALVRALDPALPDSKKLEGLQQLPDSQGKAYLAFLMTCRAWGMANRSFVLRDEGCFQQALNLFYVLAQSGNGFRAQSRDYVPVHTMLLKSLKRACRSLQGQPAPENPASDQTAPAQAAVRPAWQSMAAARVALPEFAGTAAVQPEQLTDAQTDELKELRSRLKKLTVIAQFFEERMICAEKIYRIQLSNVKASAPDKAAALLDYGRDYFNYHWDQDTPEEKELARNAIFELVDYVGSVKKTGVFGADRTWQGKVSELESAVERYILYRLLNDSQRSIGDLIAQFARHRDAFEQMKNMLRQDELLKDAAGTVFAALDILVKAYEEGVSPATRRLDLIRANNRIGSIACSEWNDLKITLQGQITGEINAIDRRPQLSLEILNTGVNPEEDCLFGEIRNHGLRDAGDITVEVSFGGRPSDRYRLSRLERNGKNAFQIRYSAPQDAESLSYSITWHYTFGGKTFYMDPKRGSLAIGRVPEPSFPLNRYETQTITDFYEDSSGKLGNPDFFGRERETAALRDLFRSGRFPSYNNAIVYGIRRAGKTTLLNYAQKYVSLHCHDAIVVKVDCLNSAGTHVVQSLFIDRVLNAVRGRYPEVREMEGWKELRDEWKLDPGSPADRDPEELELFYQELKQVTGKGLILMLDEVDNFFAAVEKQTSLDSRLFQVLSNMLCNPSSQEAIHFILCGSKYLLRYRTGDGGLSQLFQRFGSNIIEVGLIPKAEMRQMLLAPYKPYPEVRITEQAIDWIWDYTQGLVWHVKLLANMVLQYVREDGRSAVYPVDVKTKIYDLVQKEYCEQFFDGINEKNKDRFERLVIDFMRSAASNRSDCVSRERLERAFAEVSASQDQLDIALDNLVKLKLIEYHAAEKGYRFSVELYRLYFRVQREYPFVFPASSPGEPSFVRIHE